eukprot:GEMP01044910.1.p2 GENE.GEMP01044910.1~~GEMP01044910.1.p2  ORF type:complete len:105 (-),score=2.35 GEMP01044910.1:1143-1457(-)
MEGGKNMSVTSQERRNKKKSLVIRSSGGSQTRVVKDKPPLTPNTLQREDQAHPFQSITMGATLYFYSTRAHQGGVAPLTRYKTGYPIFIHNIDMCIVMLIICSC